MNEPRMAAMLVASGNAGLAPASGQRPAGTGFRPLRVAQKIRESRSVISLVLEPVDGRPLATPLPGQFVVLRLKPASSTAAPTRSYSVSGEPSTERYRVSVKREPGGTAGTYVEEKLQAGDVVDASAPRGNFALTSGEGVLVLLSAGIGATPVLAMLHALAAAGSPREVWWLHGARNGQEHPFAAEARALLKALPNGHCDICYSSPDPKDRPGLDFDARGRLDMRVLQGLDVPHDADFYVCGPPAFMSSLTAGPAIWGIAASRIHTEIFGAGPTTNPGIATSQHQPPHVPSGPPGVGPLVSFARSGIEVRWRPAYQSLLELAEACDIPVRWSCRSGVCHTCESGLVLGTVSYEPDPIEMPWEGNVLICCSRPRGDVVVDL